MLIGWDKIRGVIERVKGHVLLYGPPGTGKTFLAYWLASTVGKNCYPVTLSGDLSAQEVLGHYVPKGGEFVWHNGPALLAWREGAIFNPNELNEASGPVQIALHSILDDPTMARLCLPSGEIVKPSPGFRCVATMNGEPEDIPLPLLNRFHLKMRVDTPSPEALDRIKNDRIREAVKAAYTDKNDKITYRDMLTVGDLLSDGLDNETAFKAVFADAWRDVFSTVDMAAATPKKKG